MNHSTGRYQQSTAHTVRSLYAALKLLLWMMVPLTTGAFLLGLYGVPYDKNVSELVAWTTLDIVLSFILIQEGLGWLVLSLIIATLIAVIALSFAHGRGVMPQDALSLVYERISLLVR
jgi:hypothetical protein